MNVAQARYIAESEKRRQTYALRRADPWGVMRRELQEYHHAMQGDPLLPEALWPGAYQGPRAAAAFRRFLRTVVRSRLVL
ncbi:MAG: hypothetical protein HY343_02610 [Lentisphaerae bacterium]|nr:hypothetical protein [Lentisphaerota bacterium]